MFLISLSKGSEQLSMHLPSVFAAILHKPAIKNPKKTPAKNHAANHIGHPLLPLTENSPFLYPRVNLTPSYLIIQLICQEGKREKWIITILRVRKILCASGGAGK